MKRRIALSLALVAVASAACATAPPETARHERPATPAPTAPAAAKPATPMPAGHMHGAAQAGADVPAFQTDAASLRNLPPTLGPEMFVGPQRVAYQMARDIPQTLAQLPCYCHCDKGFGHKSLHSCFEDDHAAHCAVCMDEAILAYRLQKQENLTPAQIRERIIAQYASE